MCLITETDWAIQNMKWLSLLGLSAWIATVFVLLKVVEVTKLRSFDPNQRLYLQSISTDFEKKITELLHKNTGDLTKTAIHFRSGKCACEALVGSHSDELATNLAAANFHNVTVKLDDLPGIGAYIPSTPAVAIFNESQQLIYLGPYAIGLGCFTDDSLINTILRYTRANYWGAQINSDVEGCYCTTQ